ncbi:MAG: single-stranded-DNA-specific exonuclease RecJ [Clostridia bacterium]|nr:single-stranded-DNA-specific exonuclease RecJ [Clostridia bacterium]
MIVAKHHLTPEELNIVTSLAERSGVSFTTAKILYTRGVDTVNKIRRFLSPGKQNFSSPYLLKGMKEAVERIKAARDEGEVVVIYGDYDADGICASSILYFALKEFGVTAYPVLPERSDGYGLSEKVIDAAMEEYNPDLIITVDCGISGHDEVEYIKDLGVDVIVTDHHELPEVLPDCVTVNCKLKGQEYPFDGLCGAGVAYKLAAALLGNKANDYLDLVALATVADSMPLIDENRDLVYEGLRLLASRAPRDCIRALAQSAKVREINSTALAFTLAPRINAAGRMGDARSALRLFLTDAPSEIFDLCAKLNEYNMMRQARCDELYESAKRKLREKGAFRRVILLEGEGWNSGILGIVAARLVSEYTRPVIMFSRSGDKLHGSARSVDNLNILEAIAKNKDLLTEFGGHSQAAGVSLSAENLPAFEAALDEYISQKYPPEIFQPRVEVEDFLEGEFPMSLAKELEMLEPFGTGNPRPLFAVECDGVDPMPLRENSPHLSFRADGLDLIYFGGAKQMDRLRSESKKIIAFEPNISRYNGEESLVGYVRNFDTEIRPGRKLGLELYMKNLWNLRRQKEGEPAPKTGGESFREMVRSALDCPYGTIFVASNLKTLENFPELSALPLSVGEPTCSNLGNCVVLVLSGGDISGYRRIIYLDDPVYSVRKTRSAEVTVNSDISVREEFPAVNATREGVGEVYALLRRFKGTKASSSAELFGAISKEVPEISRYQFVFAAEVLGELGIISFGSGRLYIDRTIRADLGDSAIYRKSGGRI